MEEANGNDDNPATDLHSQGWRSGSMRLIVRYQKVRFLPPARFRRCYGAWYRKNRRKSEERI